MSTPFLGEIFMFAGNFAPRGYAFCNGQILPISQNTALFSLLGTTYGGDGISTFALPNLQGRVPIHFGQSSGTSDYVLGESSGQETVVLNTSEMPAHTHTLMASTAAATATTPAGNALAQPARPEYVTATPATAMNAASLSTVGSTQAHPNVQPYLAISFIIALQGIFPSRN